MSSKFIFILFLTTLSLTSCHVIDFSSDDVTTQLPPEIVGVGGEGNQEGVGSLPATLSPPTNNVVGQGSNKNSAGHSSPLPVSSSSPPSSITPASPSTTESVSMTTTTTTTTAAPTTLPPSTTLSPSSSAPIQTPSTSSSLNQIENNSSSTGAVSTGQPTASKSTTTTARPRPTVVSTAAPAPVKPVVPTFPVPLAKDPIGVKLYLYTRFHSHAPYMLDANSIDSLKGAYFTFSYTGPNAANARERAKNRKLYIVIHGLQDGIDVTPWMRTVKSRLLDVDRDSNVVLVDWSRGAAVSMLNDLRFASVRIVGQQTVQLIKGLLALYPESFSPENVHVIAHSFGTFAADVTGRNIHGLGRITGLDPAGGVSNVANLPASQRLDPSDAKFVDIIHTDAPKPANAPMGLNSSPLPQITLPGASVLRRPAAAAAAASASGTSIPMGHFDFYPNGGYAQPGCNALAHSPAAGILRPLLPAAGAGAANLKKLLTCSHSRAIDLFIESIRHRDSPGCSLLSYSCSNYTAFLEAKCTLCSDGQLSASDVASGHSTCALMGYNSVDHFSQGDSGRQFYVTTNSRAPYCLYHYGVAAKIAKKPKSASRGGVLLVNLDGEYVSAASSPNLEVKIIGGINGFRPGKTVRAIFTHFADVGAIKSATVSWVPASNIASLFSQTAAPTLHVQALKVYPMSFAEPQTRKTISRSLCPPAAGFTSLSSLLSGALDSPSRNDPPVAVLSAFFKEVTFNPNRCTHHSSIQFRSEEDPEDLVHESMNNVTIVATQ